MKEGGEDRRLDGICEARPNFELKVSTASQGSGTFPRGGCLIEVEKEGRKEGAAANMAHICAKNDQKRRREGKRSEGKSTKQKKTVY